MRGWGFSIMLVLLVQPAAGLQRSPAGDPDSVDTCGRLGIARRRGGNPRDPVRVDFTLEAMTMPAGAPARRQPHDWGRFAGQAETHHGVYLQLEAT